MGKEQMIQAAAQVVSELDRVWWDRLSDDYRNQEHCSDAYLEHHILSAKVAVAVLLDALVLPNVQRDFNADFDALRKSEGGILSSNSPPEADDPILSASELLSRYISATQRIIVAPSQDLPPADLLEHAVTMLQNINLAAHGTNTTFSTEREFDVFCEAVLRPLFPDLDSSPVIQVPVGYRQPDSALPSIGTLIEYKFLGASADKSRIVDEIQADIRNYAHDKRWRNFIVVVVQTDHFLTPQQLDTHVTAGVSDFKSIRSVLVKHP